jgi:hypothetical protein
MSDHTTAEPTSPIANDTASETHNSEQDERGDQAQDVAADALKGEGRAPGATESRKAPSPGVDNIGGNETDLVDVMQRMEDTGEIDNSAFAGEPDHDDEPGLHDDTGAVEDEDADSEIDQLHVTDRP